jgi:hypothetical protein
MRQRRQCYGHIQTRRIRIAETLPEATTLVKVLENFRAKIAPNATSDLLADWREAPHDDLVLAVAVAAWYAERFGHESVTRCYPIVLTAAPAWYR